MKYSKTNQPPYCPQNQSTWLKGAVKNSTPVGILWHDTAGGNPNISRYVQPDDNAADKQHWLNLLGKNKYGNDWNHIEREAGLNCWIGKLADGSVATVQTGPWTTTPWGCGSGSKGSCNGYIIKNGSRTYDGQHWIQFEICDDGYKSKEYFEAAFEEACQLTAYLCHEFNIDPNGSVIYNGVTVPTILCHADSYKLKLGGNHGDIYSWFNRFGKDMNDVRIRVTEILNGESEMNSDNVSIKLNIKLGDQVKLRSGVSKFSNGQSMASWLGTATLYVREIRSDRTVVISTLKEGAVTGVVYAKDLIKLDGTSAIIEELPITPTIMYRVRKSWTDVASQIGEYSSLDSAKDCCDTGGFGYHVFDVDGSIVYSAKASNATLPELPEEPEEQPSINEVEVSEDESKHVGNLLLNLIYSIVKIIKRLFGKTE